MKAKSNIERTYKEYVKAEKSFTSGFKDAVARFSKATKAVEQLNTSIAGLNELGNPLLHLTDVWESLPAKQKRELYARYNRKISNVDLVDVLNSLSLGLELLGKNVEQLQKVTSEEAARAILSEINSE